MASSSTRPTRASTRVSTADLDETFETFSLICAILGIGGYIKPIVNFIKVILAILYFLAASPLAMVAAYFVETAENPGCYSWSEVGWRCLAGFGIWINGALMYIFLPLEQSDGTRSPYVALILGYCVGIGVLIIVQALLGRWFEEKETGKGNEIAKEFWRNIVMIYGVDTTEHETGSTSWAWAISLFSIHLGLLFFTVAKADLAEWKSVTGKCLSSCSDDQSCSEPDMVSAMFDETCMCCMLMVADASILDLITEIGGSMVFYYGITKIVALFFVWAENETSEGKETNGGATNGLDTNGGAKNGLDVDTTVQVIAI